MRTLLRHKTKKNGGFTLVELVIVIIVIGILAAVAIPKFLDFTTDANEAATKGGLGGVRSGIANYYAYSATPSGGGVVGFPTLVQISDGTVMASRGRGRFLPCDLPEPARPAPGPQWSATGGFNPTGRR